MQTIAEKEAVGSGEEHARGGERETHMLINLVAKKTTEKAFSKLEVSTFSKLGF